MTKKFRQEIVSVINYLKNGTEDIPSGFIDKYISHLLSKSVELPLHYQLRIDDIKRRGESEELLQHIAEVTGCVAFLKDDDHYLLRGLGNVAEHPKAKTIYTFLEHPKNILDHMEANFSLYPLLISTKLDHGEYKADDIALVTRSYGDKVLGLLGHVNLDYELAIGIFRYLSL